MQLSLFVAEPERSVIDEVRKKYDPRQHANIPAHVTLCRDNEVDDWCRLKRKLAEFSEASLQFIIDEVEELSDRCILMRLRPPATSFHELREHLLGNDCSSTIPHITLLHPKNAQGNSPLERIRNETLPTVVHFSEINLIIRTESGVWRMKSTYPIGI